MAKILFLIFFITASLFSYTFEDIKNFENRNGTLKALKFYKQLVEQDNQEAMIYLARVYLEGKGIEKSFSKAQKLLQKASDLGNNKASYYLGKFYLSKKTPYFNLAKAYNSFVKAANNNYPPALNMVGEFLVNGIAVKKDYKLAVKLFEKAAKQDFINAQCNLAFMYASGKGVFPNFGRANVFAKKGKELGNKRCIKVWNDFNLAKYPEDKGFKFNFYTKPSN